MNNYDHRTHATRQPIPVLSLTDSFAAGLAACQGVLEWRDIDPATRADLRARMCRHFIGRLLHAREALCRDPSLVNAERVDRMERGWAAARRLM